jgi:DNA-binding SARP family transcriptional activator
MTSWHLLLLDGFRLVLGRRTVALAPQMERLLALLAVHAGWTSRYVIADMLWPDRPEKAGLAALRTAVWRLQRCAPGVVDAGARTLCLHPTLRTDVSELVWWAQHVIRSAETLPENELLLPDLGRELLPGWYDEWLDLERRRLHQLRVHAVEAAVEELLGRKRFSLALPGALELVQADPLRESAHRLLVRIHLAEGNVAAALDQFASCRLLLASELGVRPSDTLSDLVSPYLHP